MSFITSIFTFKRKFQEAVSSEKVQDIIKKARLLIITYKEYSQLSGAEKKHRVDSLLGDYIKEVIHSDNEIVQWLLEKFVADGLPMITQFIYDHLKENVKGITREQCQ